MGLPVLRFRVQSGTKWNGRERTGTNDENGVGRMTAKKTAVKAKGKSADSAGGAVVEGAARAGAAARRGRPPGARTIRDVDGRTLGEMARAYSVVALKTLREIAEDEKNSPNVRAQASQAILQRGWADAPPVQQAGAMDGVTINVQNLIVQGSATPGVMQSPIVEHLAAPAEDASEVVDVDGSTVQPVQHEGP